NFVNIPSRAQSLVLMAEDADASTGGFSLGTQPGTNWVHWAVWNLPASVHSLSEGFDPTSVGASVGTNSFGLPSPVGDGNPSAHVKYEGPQPPAGSATHNYQFK